MTTIQIRPATKKDKRFVLSLVSRFVEFGPPAWRNPESIQRKTEQQLLAALKSSKESNCILIATNEGGESLGFIHLERGEDYFTGEPYGYISDVAVVDSSEGRGVGQALMEAAERWAKEQGYTTLALDVFAQNRRACRFYEKLGYHEEVRKYTKDIDL